MQPAYPPSPFPAPAPGPKKSNVGKIVAGCLLVLLLSCCCCSGIGGYVAYLDNRSLYTPGDEVSRVPMVPGAPQQLSAAFTGSNYGFVQIWAEIDAQQTGPDLVMNGTASCQTDYGGGTYPQTVDIMVWPSNARVADFERSGDHVTANVMVHYEYMREGESARTCTVTLSVTGGTITSGSLVVRNYQRPSDRFAN